MENKSKLTSEEIVAMAIGGIGTIAFGLGLYGLNTDNPGALHPLFDNRLFVLSLTGVGVVLMIVELKMMWPVWMARRRAQQEGR